MNPIVRMDIPESFFQEEVRCGYTVSAEMKKVWAKQLELYGVFKEVCDRHGIRYFWAYGNLLGAVRHQGYIPWDDDIDVFVTREDYTKLCQIAEKEFSAPYFFQNDHTDPGSHIAFGKLRNSETTAILDFEAPSKYRYNQGIFLDIFPLDNVPDDPEELAAFTKKIVFWKRMTQKWARMFDSRAFYFGRKWMRVTIPFVLLAKGVIRLLRIPNIPCRMLEKTMQSYNGRPTQRVCMLGLGEVKPYPRECFAGTVLLPYEFLEVPAPAGYLRMLDIEYGDWTKFVRGAAGGNMHEGMNYDTERPYTDYL